LARTPRDIELVFDVIAHKTATSPRVEAGRRVGVVRGGWSSVGAVAAAVDATARALERAGYDVTDIDAAPFVEASAVFAAWRAADDHADLRSLVSGREADLTPHIAWLLSTPPTATDVAEVAERFEAVVRAVCAVLASTPILVLPVARVGVLGLEETSVEIDGALESVDALQILAPSRSVSLLGLPALAVPAGVDDDGLPIGVQLVGGAGSEHALVSAATDLLSSPALDDAPLGAVDGDG
jgi:Asp-tRNA(Asn)/Glu-tRNA(Gln) amidotransferase A subunit family amidase